MVCGHSNLAQITRLTEDITPNYPIPQTEEEALSYLYFIDRTQHNNGYTLDLINYEKLIYIEVNFSSNKKIQQLLINIKENIANNFILKHKYIQRITDDLCPNIVSTTYKQGLKKFDQTLVIRGCADFEYFI